MLQRIFRVVLAGLLPFLVACAGSKLPLYDGTKQSPAQIATLTIPEQIDVARLNGVEVKGASGLWTHGDKTLELAPGRYEVLAYYREIWRSGDQHDVLRSDPVLFVLDAKAGGRYHLEYQHPANYSDAQRLAAHFSATLIDEATGARMPSSPSGVQFQTGLIAQINGNDELTSDKGSGRAGGPQVVAPLEAAAPRTPATVSAGPRTTSMPPVEAPAAAQRGDWLVLMQSLWKQANPEERRAFLRWLAEQPN